MADCAADNRIGIRDIDRLLAAHDGDMALLCLWLYRHRSDDLEAAARDLCRTLAEMEAAFEKLRRNGLLPGDAGPARQEPPARSTSPAVSPVLPPDELPEYTARDLAERGDPAFLALVDEAKRVLGHALSTPDLKTLFGIYDFLALPAEVVMQLLHYCVAVSKGRLPSMRYIEREAFVWARRKILTLEQADAYIADQLRRRQESTAVAELLGIRGREMTPSESRYVQTWISEGTPRELIELAYDRTVTNTGSLKWGYMNKILLSWKEKGLKTAAEVREKDLPPRRGKQPVKAVRQPGTRDIGRLLEEMEKS